MQPPFAIFLKESKMEFKLTLNGNEFPIEIFESATLANQETVVDSIVDALFANEKYSPVRYTYVFWREVLREYTTLDVDMDEDKFMYLIGDEGNGLIAEVKEKINHVQLDNIENAVDELIAARLSKSESDKFWADARALLRKVDGLVSSIDPKSVQKLVNKFSKLDETKIVQAILTLQKKATDVKDVK